MNIIVASSLRSTFLSLTNNNRYNEKLCPRDWRAGDDCYVSDCKDPESLNTGSTTSFRDQCSDYCPMFTQAEEVSERSTLPSERAVRTKTSNARRGNHTVYSNVALHARL